MLNLSKKMGRKEFARRAEEIINALRTEVTAFEDTSERARKARVERGLRDHFYFFRTYLPHYFSLPEAPFHHDLVELLDERDLSPEAVLVPVAVAAPRGFSKTTITSFGYVCHQICHGLRHFPIIGSDTKDLASDITGYLYLELLYNERIKADFGELIEPDLPVDDYVTRNDIRVLARGSGQRLRGVKHKQWRPDLVVLDDMENDQNVRNPKQVRKLLKWIVRTVFPAIEPTGNLFIIGTLLAVKSALAIILAQQEEPWVFWKVRRYQGLQPDGTSLWPARWPVVRLEALKQQIGGLAFAQEIQNAPADEEGMFREAWVKTYEPEELIGKALRVLCGGDPSAGSGQSNDSKALIILGQDPDTTNVYVLAAWIRRESPRSFVLRFYDAYGEFHFQLGLVEENSLKDYLWSTFEQVAKEKRFWLPLRGVHHLQSKEGRLVKVSALMERGKLFFRRNHTDQNELIDQLLAFPNATVHDDGPDALEMAYSGIEIGAGEIAYKTVEPGRFAGQVGAF